MRLLVLLLLLTACGPGASGSSEPSPTPAARPTSSAQPTGGDAITGKLGGDPQLEGGCGWLDAGGTRWQVQYPPGWELSLDPVRLTGPEGQTAEEGETVTVTGAEQADVVTTCQVGPVWAADSVTLAS